MKTSILKIEGLSHRYTQNWAIRDISFEIDQTGIVGLLGSNGAGKSTTMNIICGVLNQTEGRVLINGIDMQEAPERAKCQIGFLPQTAPLHLDLTVDEYLIHCAYLRLVPDEHIPSYLREAKVKCGIGHMGQRLIRNLSGGYRQRVGIAQAVIHKPQLVVLDEPTNGLDPNQIIEVRALIREIARDRAVIFSTHILTEVQLLCKEIKMIENGQMVFSDTMDAFNNYVVPHSLTVHLENPPALDDLLQIAGITHAEPLTAVRFRLYFDGDQSVAGNVVQASVNQNWQLLEIGLDKSSIDEVFAKLSNKSPRQTNL